MLLKNNVCGSQRKIDLTTNLSQKRCAFIFVQILHDALKLRVELDLRLNFIILTTQDDPEHRTKIFRHMPMHYSIADCGRVTREISEPRPLVLNVVGDVTLSEFFQLGGPPHKPELFILSLTAGLYPLDEEHIEEALSCMIDALLKDVNAGVVVLIVFPSALQTFASISSESINATMTGVGFHCAVIPYFDGSV